MIMPYIKQEQRPFIDLLVNLFLSDGKVRGRLNYFIFKLCIEYIKSNKESYSEYADFLMDLETIRSELEMCKLEIYRRYIAPYENKKIKENGDVE